MRRDRFQELVQMSERDFCEKPGSAFSHPAPAIFSGRSRIGTAERRLSPRCRRLMRATVAAPPYLEGSASEHALGACPLAPCPAACRRSRPPDRDALGSKRPKRREREPPRKLERKSRQGTLPGYLQIFAGIPLLGAITAGVLVPPDFVGNAPKSPPASAGRPIPTP